MLTEHICPPGSLSPLMNVRVTWSLNQILIILYRQEGKRFSFFFCFKIVWKSFVDSKSHVQLFYSYHWGRKWPRQRQRLKMSESQWQDRNWDWKIWVSMIRLGKRCWYWEKSASQWQWPRPRLKKSESQWWDCAKDVDIETPLRLSLISASPISGEENAVHDIK